MKNKISSFKISVAVIQILILSVVTFTILLQCTNIKVVVKQVQPILEFPQMGIDDPVAYHGYTTRFYQDSKGNSVQIVINKNNGRIVNTWADAANESIAFTARDTTGKPAVIQWSSPGAEVSSDGQTRFVQYTLSSESSSLDIGLFMLASMRVERNYQYSQRHLLPFGAEKYLEPELIKLIDNLKQLPASVRLVHLSLLNAENIEQLRNRLTPHIISNENGQIQSVIITHSTFDGKNHLSLEFSVDKNNSDIKIFKEKILIHSLKGEGIRFIVKIETDSPSLTPLNRSEIFNKEFLQFYNRKKVKHDSLLIKTEMSPQKAIKNEHELQFIHLDRQVKSLELLSSHEKLMAGMPNYATYFGRDMMMSALMLEPICTPEILEHVIASVLLKLSPSGEVSHEEALGGQAIRENAAKYNGFIAEYLQYNAKTEKSKADSALLNAEKLLENLQLVVENYRMVDDDFQLPVLAARYLTNPDISDSRKQAFLRANSGKIEPITRLSLLMRNFQYILKVTHSYTEHPAAEDLVSFKKSNEQHWISGSWRDSNAGYANGRFAMDVNAIWIPKALESIGKIFAVLQNIGFTLKELELKAPAVSDNLLNRYLTRPEIL